MSVWRNTEDGRCPIEGPVDYDICSACRYFRGASWQTFKPGIDICCNWPRDGSHLFERPIPPAFAAAFDDDRPSPDDRIG